MRRRLQLVRQKTLNHLSLQSLIVRESGERLTANQVKALDNDAIAERLVYPVCLGGQITGLLMHWPRERARVLYRRTGYARALWFFWSSELLGSNTKCRSAWILMGDWCVSFQKQHDREKREVRIDDRYCMMWGEDLRGSLTLLTGDG